MRMPVVVVLLACVALGCEHGEGGAVFCLFGGEPHRSGESFPAGDGCNVCTCDAGGDVSCSEIECNGDGGIIIVDAGLDRCAPSAGCIDGVECDGVCCQAGEQCLFGACSCGGGSACIEGDICAAGGPVGGESCGSICCGQSTPCPL